MLTFTEELALLLNDEDGAPLPIRQDIVACALAGAVLMDLAFAYRIDTDLEALFVNHRTPTGNPALDRILARITARTEVCDTKTWIGVLSVEEAPAIHEQTLAGLVERGILTVRESRLPWTRSRRYPSSDGKTARELRQHVADVLTSDEIPDPRDVALISLLDACEILPDIFPRQEIEDFRPRIALLRK
ncbi:MAG: GPP34 family phosphoprotein, partial [Chloroflexi bacterium]|nr:GPP34 family phosphoprotein [Chloroflexota bacterium]